MKRLGISNQIIVISMLPVLIISVILSTYYIANQFSLTTESLNKSGELIAKQLSPAAEYAVYSGNTEFINFSINTIMKNNPVLRIQVVDKYKNHIIDVKTTENLVIDEGSILQDLIADKQQLKFIEPIFSAQVSLDDDASSENQETIEGDQTSIGNVIVTLTSHYATKDKIQYIKNGALITLLIMFITAFIIIYISRRVTQPIKSLTKTVRDISSGNLDVSIEKDSVGEIGVLQACIKHMTDTLRHSQSDMENQLDEYTNELQETMEELEIRNAELDITRSKAIYANNAKSEFLANMSHEIRTPLSGIIGFTELLHGTKLTTQQKDYSNTIQKSAKSLLEIINDILDLAKIESGKTEITKSEFNLTEIIEDIINLLTPSALNKNIEIFYRVEDNVPNIIHSDPFRIHQILTNLIGNAIKFTEKGYIYLQVTKGEIAKTDASVKFTVSDTGIGMNSNDKRKLFKAFTQADTSITRRFGGTGLGLVISRKLTILMKGEIGFDSTEGEGSTFWFSVPVTPVSVEYVKPELADKKIALFCNHYIAKQTLKTMFTSSECLVSDYTLDDLNRLHVIEKDKDAIVLFLSRKEINDTAILEKIHNLTINTPSLLIASTRSHKELRDLQQHIFDSAVFTSERIVLTKQKLISAINANTDDPKSVDMENMYGDTTDWSNLNVMVVDDNEINLRLVEILLHKYKTRVTTARSGAEAIDYASFNTYDLIFMDLHMPGIDGYETTLKIRHITPGKQPVILALTANALPQEKEKVIKSGMNGILIKPVSDSILKKVINQWVLKKSTDTFDADENATMKHHKSENIFSLELAKEFTGNNEELAYELFHMLRAELESYNTEISAAVDDDDLKKLRDHVHKLHGASRCCGTTELKLACSHLENLIDKKISFDLKKETSLLLTAIQNVADYELDTDIKPDSTTMD
jgi:two-component system sensor histidine kinase BarA